MERRDEMAEAEERAFWLAASESALRKIWGDPGDDVYEELMDVAIRRSDRLMAEEVRECGSHARTSGHPTRNADG
ncbi:MAG TPA: hypothetical protein VEX86_09220 [Longimicrobium sp.]|nr:hypothetical protein [Longimicrobium sp.]